MAEFDNLDFGIQDTMEMGLGNAELLNNLLAPETSTTSPDDITEIKNDPPAEKKAAAPKQAAKPAPEDKEEKKTDTSIQDFIYGDNEEKNEDEEEEEKSKTPPHSNNEEDDEEETETSPFESLSKDLIKLGVFQTEEGEEVNIKTPEEFLERFNNEKKKGAIQIVQDFIGQFGEDYQQAFDAIFVKGVDPKEYFNTYNQIQSFTGMDLSREENQVRVIRQALHDQGFEAEDIDTEVERLKNYGDLETVATRHHKVLVKKEAAKLQQMEQEKEAQLKQQAAYKQQYIGNVNTILQDKVKAKEFDGIPLSPKLAQEVQDFLVTDKYKTPGGELLTDFDKTILDLKRPENHEKKVKVALLLKMLEKDPTLATIQKTAITKKSDELFTEVARHTKKGNVKTTTNTKQPTSWFQ